MLSLLALSLVAADAPRNERCYENILDVDRKIRAYEYLGDRVCHDFKAPERMTGIWWIEFEQSEFFPNAKILADLSLDQRLLDYNSIWLTADKETRRPSCWPNEKPEGLYRVEFIGRFVKDMNRAPLDGYGHMGIFRGLVLVDEFISIEQISTVDDIRAITG